MPYDIEHFKKRVNQLLDFIEENGLVDKFNEWGKKKGLAHEDIADIIMKRESDIWHKYGWVSSGQIRRDKIKHDIYVIEIVAMLKSLNIVKRSLPLEISQILENHNWHLLNTTLHNLDIFEVDLSS